MMEGHHGVIWWTFSYTTFSYSLYGADFRIISVTKSRIFVPINWNNG